MDFTSLQNEARKKLENAKTKAAHDDNVAKVAKRTSKAAKLKLKEARKLAKSTKKSARKAAYQAEKSQEALHQATSKWEKLEKRARRKKSQTASPSVSREKPAPSPGQQRGSSVAISPRVAKPSAKRRRRKSTAGTPTARRKGAPSGARAALAPGPVDSVIGKAVASASEATVTSESRRTSVKS
jgi:hypothetical protein